MTAHIGKFLNGYGSEWPPDLPRGWTEWYGLIDHSTYRMWGYSLFENGDRRTYGDVLQTSGPRATRPTCSAGRPSTSSAGGRPTRIPSSCPWRSSPHTTSPATRNG